jgi:hypothetical protein
VLAFPSIQPSNSGAYSVTVTNAAGSTGAVAQLNVVTAPPVIYVSPVSGGSTFNLSVSTASGVTCQVYHAGSPAPAAWLPLTNFTGNGAVMSAGTISATVSNQFFRVAFP